MIKKLLIALSHIFIYMVVIHASLCQPAAAQLHKLQINTDTLTEILSLKEDVNRQKRLINFIKQSVQSSNNDKLAALQDTFNLYFNRYKIAEKDAFSAFIKSISLNKQHKLTDAENYMLKAIQLAEKTNEHYLSFQFLSHLGFIQTDQGNFIGAIYNYRMATKEVRILKDKFGDNRREASLNINISDLFYKTGFYSEALNYLDRAWALLDGDKKNKELLSSVIYYNKAEIFFRMKHIDSLKAYHVKLNHPGNVNYKIFTYRQRTAYYINLLNSNYATAINQIKILKQQKDYVPSELENQHLADAFYLSGQLDSARQITNKLLAANTDNNHPEIKYHLYETLAWIASKKGDHETAADNYRLALEQSQENNIRLAQVGNISSQIRIDETESSYIQKAEAYKRERLWLLFIVLIAALSIVVITLFYRNVKQKRHYEKLLFAAKKEELAFINSHEARKHLTNILGIIDVLKNSENKLEEYKLFEDYLLQSASLLDDALKNFSEKLTDEEDTEN